MKVGKMTEKTSGRNGHGTIKSAMLGLAAGSISFLASSQLDAWSAFGVRSAATQILLAAVGLLLVFTYGYGSLHFPVAAVASAVTLLALIVSGFLLDGGITGIDFPELLAPKSLMQLGGVRPLAVSLLAVNLCGMAWSRKSPGGRGRREVGH